MKYNYLFFFGLFLLGLQLTSQNKTSTVIQDSLFSISLNQFVSYEIYLPKSYGDATLFPITYLLHGHGGNEHNWFEKNRGNIQSVLDSLIHLKKIPEMVAISFDAKNTWYVDGPEKMESAFVKDIIPFIETNYTIKREQAYRILAGLSAGGFGALNFSLKFPSLFHSTILLSPASYFPEPPLNSSSRKVTPFLSNNTFDSEKWKSYSYQNLTPYFSEKQPLPKFYISTGDDDVFNILEVVSQLQNFMNKHQIAQEVTVINGGHDWKVWRNRFIFDLLRIYN